jgi:hypothetical protein
LQGRKAWAYAVLTCFTLPFNIQGFFILYKLEFTMSIIKLLRHSNWIAVNKDLVKLVGCNSAYLLGYLADRCAYFESRNEIRPDGFFFATAADVEEELGLTSREQDGAIKRLVLANFIETAVKGIPAKRYFRFSQTAEQALESSLFGKTSFDKSAKLDMTKAQNSVQQNGQTIYKEHTNISNNQKGLNGDFQSPIAPTNPPDEKAEFSAWLLSIGCSKLSQTNFFLEKEKSCAKKEKHGEAGYLQALADIEKYLIEKPKYLADKKDFARVVDNFAVPIDVRLGKSAFSAFFGAKFGEGKETYSKGEVTALKTIADALKTNAGSDKELEKHFKQFFKALGGLPKYQNPFNCKLNFIASDLPAIFFTLKNPNTPTAAANIETFKERDERLAKEKEAERQTRQFEQERIKAEKAQIVRFLDAGYPLTPEMLQSAAYRELYGNGETF